MADMASVVQLFADREDAPLSLHQICAAGVHAGYEFMDALPASLLRIHVQHSEPLPVFFPCY